MKKLFLILCILTGCSNGEGQLAPPSNQTNQQTLTNQNLEVVEHRYNKRINIVNEGEAEIAREQTGARIFAYLCDISDNGDTLNVALRCENMYKAWGFSGRFLFTDDIATYIPGSWKLVGACGSSTFDGDWDEWCNINYNADECHFCRFECEMGPFRHIDGRDQLNFALFQHYEDNEPTRICDHMNNIGSQVNTMFGVKFLRRKAGVFKIIASRFYIYGDDALGGNEECRTILYNVDSPGDSLQVRLPQMGEIDR